MKVWCGEYGAVGNREGRGRGEKRERGEEGEEGREGGERGGGGWNKQQAGRAEQC